MKLPGVCLLGSKTDTQIANILISSDVVASMDMADKTHHETMLSRSDAAEYIESLGHGLGDDGQSWTVPVGNKRVDIQPASELSVETTVDERSRLLGDDITEVTVHLSWTDSGESTEEMDSTGSTEGGGSEP